MSIERCAHSLLYAIRKIKELNKNIYLIILLNFFVIFCNGQNSEKVIINTENCNELIAGIDNYISIIAIQDSSLFEEHTSAYLITPNRYLNETKPIKLQVEKKYGKYFIHPDSVGVAEFHIKLNNDIEIKSIKVNPLEAVCRLSRYKANSESKIPKGEFKAQMGIVAYVECCGFDARCKMISFEVIRIPTNEISARTLNNGGKFEKATLKLIHQAEAGDLYIFRNIYYQCPNTEKQRSEDMIIEIQ